MRCVLRVTHVRATNARTHARTHAHGRSRHARARTTARACAERVLGEHGAGPHAAVGEGAGSVLPRTGTRQCNAMQCLALRQHATWRKGGVAALLLRCKRGLARLPRPPRARRSAAVRARACLCLCSHVFERVEGGRDGGDVCAVALNAAHRRLAALGFSRSSPSEVARGRAISRSGSSPFCFPFPRSWHSSAG
jgi:hypothetical protein